jgi:hypothetical protein
MDTGAGWLSINDRRSWGLGVLTKQTLSKGVILKDVDHPLLFVDVFLKRARKEALFHKESLFFFIS